MPVKQIHLYVVVRIVFFAILKPIYQIVLNSSGVHELLSLRFIVIIVEKLIYLEEFFALLYLTYKILWDLAVLLYNLLEINSNEIGSVYVEGVFEMELALCS